MKYYFRYLGTECVRVLQAFRFWLAILSVTGCCLLCLLDEIDMQLDVMYVFRMATGSLGFLLVYFVTAVPYANGLAEDLEHKYYRYALIRGNFRGYIRAKLTVIFMVPLLVETIGLGLFVAFLRLWLPWEERAGLSLRGLVGNGWLGSLLDNGHYYLYILLWGARYGILLGILNLLAAYCSLYLYNKMMVWTVPLLSYFLLQYLLLLTGVINTGLSYFFENTNPDSPPIRSVMIGIIAFIAVGWLIQHKVERLIKND